MKTSTIKLVAVFTVLGLVSANVAVAKNGNNGNHSNHNNNNHNNHSSSVGKVLVGAAIAHSISNHSNYNNGSYKYSNNYNSGYGSSCHSGYGGYGGGYGNVVTSTPANVGQAFEPFHSNYVVLPGDTFFEVSLKEYGTSANSRFIAQFNGLQESAALTPGQILQLPSISVNGQLAQSRAPIADALQANQNVGGVANFTPSTASSGIGSLVSNVVTTPAPVVEAPRPKVSVGSTLLVDGQSFGPQQGAARLRVGGATLKIEVLEWTTGSVKIRLPNLDLDSTMKADIEVVRADNSLASRTPIELGAASVVAAR